MSEPNKQSESDLQLVNQPNSSLVKLPPQVRVTASSSGIGSFGHLNIYKSAPAYDGDRRGVGQDQEPYKDKSELLPIIKSENPC